MSLQKDRSDAKLSAIWVVKLWMLDDYDCSKLEKVFHPEAYKKVDLQKLPIPADNYYSSCWAQRKNTCEVEQSGFQSYILYCVLYCLHTPNIILKLLNSSVSYLKTKHMRQMSKSPDEMNPIEITFVGKNWQWKPYFCFRQSSGKPLHVIFSHLFSFRW